jgi:ubiquinone/menaquinone biosynthesis C-methylase UbiE
VLAKEDAMATEMTHEDILAIAEAIAPGWERRRGQIEQLSAPVREWLVRALDPRPGDTVLELAAGAGDTGFDAAALVGARGTLLCTDVSPGMLAVASRRGEARGVANAEYRVIDAQRIELADDSVDGILCRFAYMLMPDPAGALREACRVLRPDGRLALAVWGPPQRNAVFAIVAGALVARGHLPPPEPPPAPGIFSLAAVQRTSGLLRDAGFQALRTEEVPVRIVLPDVGEYIALIADTAGPIGLALQRLSADEHELVQARVQAACEPFACPDGYALPGLALCAVGTA